MTKKTLLLGMLAMALAFGMAVVGCNNDPMDWPSYGGGTPETVTYTSTAEGTTYTLTITENTRYAAVTGDAYVLIITSGGITSAPIFQLQRYIFTAVNTAHCTPNAEGTPAAGDLSRHCHCSR